MYSVDAKELHTDISFYRKAFPLTTNIPTNHHHTRQQPQLITAIPTGVDDAVSSPPPIPRTNRNNGPLISFFIYVLCFYLIQLTNIFHFL